MKEPLTQTPLAGIRAGAVAQPAPAADDLPVPPRRSPVMDSPAMRPAAPVAEDLPEPERALRIAEAAGFRLPPGDTGALAVRRDATAPAVVADLDRYVVVHPGASVPARSWPEARHRELVAAYADRGVPVVVTGSPGER